MKKSFNIVRSLALLTLALLVMALPPSSALTTAAVSSVRVRPVGGQGLVDSSFVIEVWIEDVADLYGADVRLGFDPDFLEVVDADTDEAGVQVEGREDLLTQPWFILRNEVDNQEGTTWYALTQLNPNEAKSGSGVFYEVTFRTKGITGTTRVSVTYQLLATRLGDEIPADVFGAEYAVVEPTAFVYLPLVVSQ
jgi:hypothetical protein